MSRVRSYTMNVAHVAHDLGITVIESITNFREAQPEFEAIYMLMPTTQNVDRIIKDFSSAKQYAAAHLFFIEGESSCDGPLLVSKVLLLV